MRSCTSFGDTAGLTTMLLKTPRTPRKYFRAYSALRRWKCHSTVPPRVMYPSACLLPDHEGRVPHVPESASSITGRPD